MSVNAGTFSQLVEIGWHLINLRVVMVLDVLQEACILWQNEVDSSSLSSESTGSTDSVDVVLLLNGKLVVDNKTNLLYVDSSGK